MRVIGKTGRDSVILIATLTEVARIMGDHSEYQSGVREKIIEGAEIPVSEMYDRVTDIQQQPGEVAKCAATLRAAADMIDKPFPSITPPAAETTSAETQ